MRRFITLVLACSITLAAFSAADAFQPIRKTWIVEVPTKSGVSDPGFTPGNSVTGVTGFSGTTTCQVREPNETAFSGVTVLDVSQFDYGFFTLQPYNLTPLSAVTPDMTDKTFTVNVHEAWVDDATGHANAKTKALTYQKTFDSGSSPWPIHFMTQADYIWIEFLSGATAFEGPQWYLIGRQARPEDEETLVTFPEQHSAFTTSGVSNDMTSGGTGFSLPDGAEWFGFFPNGDNVPYSTDGTDASTSGLYFPDGEEKILPRAEAENLGTAANGDSTGQLNMTPYSRRPY